MRSNTQRISLSGQSAEVFAFLADPLNLPRWAVGFCRSIRRDGEDRWMVETPSGGRQHIEPLLAKVWVERERGPHHSVPHDVKAAAIDETQLPTISREQCVLCVSVVGLGDPIHVERREHVAAQHPNGFHPESMPNERCCLDDDVVRDE